tara:strand:+ start:3477 stop:3953 length:477 start_codon:yes stop_codon:yes gene_type:complete
MESNWRDLLMYVNVIILLYVFFFVPFKNQREYPQKTYQYNLNINDNVKELFKSIDKMIWYQIENDIEVFMAQVYDTDVNGYKASLVRIEYRLNQYIFRDMESEKRRKIKVEIDNIMTTLNEIVRRRAYMKEDWRPRRGLSIDRSNKVLEHNYNDYYDN